MKYFRNQSFVLRTPRISVNMGRCDYQITTMLISEEEETRSLLIIYATETGNAQDAADYIARQCRRIAFRCRVASIDAFSLVSLSAFEDCTWTEQLKARSSF